MRKISEAEAKELRRKISFSDVAYVCYKDTPSGREWVVFEGDPVSALDDLMAHKDEYIWLF